MKGYDHMKRPARLLAVVLIFALSITAAYAEEWICSNCGKTNTTNFCTNCGQKHDVWLCPNCGEENSDAFCGNCGTPRPVDLSFLYGTWKYNQDDSINFFFTENNTLLMAHSVYGVMKGTYTATSNRITMFAGTTEEVSTHYSFSDNTLCLEDMNITLTKTEKPAVFKVAMDGDSMNDTFSNGTILYFEYKDIADIQRFDIVATYYPKRNYTVFTKRVVGLPGDIVEIRDGYLYVNNEKYDEPYINDEYRSGRLDQFEPYTVPENHYFVLGDHRNSSNDSRFVGALDANMLIGVMTRNPDLDIFSGHITGFHWVRTIDIEKASETPGSGWTLPDGATLTDQIEEIHHYDSVLDHYEEVEVERSRQVFDHNEIYYTYTDNNNGTFTEVPHERPVYTTEYYTETVQQPVYTQVPRYQTKYYYTTKSWQYSRQLTSSGDNQNPSWPTDSLASDERQGQQSQIYTLTVSDGENTQTYKVEESYWTSVNPGDIIYITFQRNTAETFISDSSGNYLAPAKLQ